MELRKFADYSPRKVSKMIFLHFSVDSLATIFRGDSRLHGLFQADNRAHKGQSGLSSLGQGR